MCVFRGQGTCLVHGCKCCSIYVKRNLKIEANVVVSERTVVCLKHETDEAIRIQASRPLAAHSWQECSLIKFYLIIFCTFYLRAAPAPVGGAGGPAPE